MVMKNILLPTDFSENSSNAIHYAFHLLKGQACNFHFLNIQKITEYLTGDIFSAAKEKSIFDAIIDDNKKKLQLLIDKFEKQYGAENFSFHATVDYDVLPDAINQSVEKNAIDMIIMGSNGVTGAKEILFGSNTLTVMRKVNCPLLIIPENYTFEKINTVLFTIHNQVVIDTTGLKPLLEILLNQKSKLKVLEINEENIDSSVNTEEIKNIFSNIPTEFYSLVELPSALTVSAFIQLNELQLHATFMEQESFLERFIFGSETSKIRYETRIPLLILHR